MKNDPISRTLESIKNDPQLHYENHQAGCLAQALLGSICSGMEAISIKCIQEKIHIYFYLSGVSPATTEEIEQTAFELEALQCTNIPVYTHVSVVDRPFPVSKVEGRLVFLRNQDR